MKKRLLAVLLAVCLLVVGLPVSAGAYDMGKVGVYQTISAGSGHSLAIKADGSLWAWGNNNSGQLGDGTRTSRSNPVKVMDNVATVSAGNYHSLAIKTDGTLWVWGNDILDQLETTPMTPVKVMDNAEAVSGGQNHSLVLKSDGSLWAWGWNQYGQLGDGTTKTRYNPVKVMDNVTAASGGYEFSLALKSDNSLWAWGRNYYGQLGDGTTTNRNNPVKVMDNVVAICAGMDNSFALKTDGSLWAWGLNRWGELGDGTTAQRKTPVKVMDDVATISAGSDHSLAIKTDGTLWAWGHNTSGQLGDGTTMYCYRPLKVMDNAVAVGTGSRFSLGVKTDGTFWAWGENNEGQLGDDTTENRHTPVKIMDGVSTGGGADVPVGPTPGPEGIQPKEMTFHTSYSGPRPITVNWGWELFDKPSSTCDSDLTKLGLVLSAGIENSAATVESQLRDLGYTEIQSKNFDGDNTLFQPAATFAHRCGTDKNGKTLHYFAVVVRGTTSSNDIITDASSLVGGFDVTAMTVAAQFRKFAQDTCGLKLSSIRRDSKFFFTGHSLGGAVANIMAHTWNTDMVGYEKDNIFAYTYASPRTTSSFFAWADGNIFNFINKNTPHTSLDPVPLVPPNKFFRYGKDKPWATSSRQGMLDSYKSLTGNDYDNFTGDVFCPHVVETYMALLQAKQGNVDAVVKTVMSMMRVACPVDVEVYDANEQLIGSVKNGEVMNRTPETLGIFVEDETKYIYFDEDGQYTVRLTGTGEGAMDYQVQSVDLSTGATVSQKQYENVALTTGKQMVTHVNVADETQSGTDTSEVKLYVLDTNGQPEKEVLPDGNGTEVPVTPGEIWNNPFQDVAEGAWYYKAVKFAHQNGLMSGTSARTFAPNTRLSRAMLAQILYNKAGKPKNIDGKKFPDVAAGAWYANAVEWAGAKGIVAGYGDGRFGPEDDITREQLATMLWRYDGSQQVTDGQLDFRDADKISSYAKIPMQWAVKNGIIGGKGNKTLDPRGYATRAEVAQMLMNYLSK